jgi:hypothetical protein
LKIAFIIALMHCMISNVVGAYSNGDGLLYYLFLPYAFISGMSSLVGWDLLSIILEVLAFGLMIIVFYPIGVLLSKNTTKKT